VWLLLLVLVAANPVTLQENETHVVVLRHHATLGQAVPLVIEEEGAAVMPPLSAGCLEWRNYIAYEMARAYPKSREFFLVCRFRPKPAV